MDPPPLLTAKLYAINTARNIIKNPAFSIHYKEDGYVE